MTESFDLVLVDLFDYTFRLNYFAKGEHGFQILMPERCSKHQGKGRNEDAANFEKMLGDKTGSGFYKKSKGDGGKEILVLDLKTFEYRAQGKVRFESLGAARDVETLDEKIRVVLGGSDKAAKFAEQVTLDTLAYAARLMGEIADDVVNVDRAMRWGFAWEQGPFQTWDAYGVAKGVARMNELGIFVAPWVEKMLAAGRTSFYGQDKQFDTFWNLGSASVNYVPEVSRQITVDGLKRANKFIKGNDSASLYDMGDGIATLKSIHRIELQLFN